MTWPRTWHLITFDMPKTWAMWVWNPITCSCSSVFRFHPIKMFWIQNRLLGPSSWKACELRKFIFMGKIVHGWLTFLTMARGGWSSCCMTCDLHFESKMTSIVRPLNHNTKSHAPCNKCGVMLVHCNQWTQNPNDVASTKIGLPNQTWT
jgi:hypothetical protein